MKIFCNILMLIFLMCVQTACTGDQGASSDPVETMKSKDKDLTGNKFADAAATHIMLNNKGLSRVKANCVVQKMTGDGTYGLGEINQMKLQSDKMTENSSGLNKAYSAALQACQ